MNKHTQRVGRQDDYQGSYSIPLFGELEVAKRCCEISVVQQVTALAASADQKVDADKTAWWGMK